tara:strand:+ start:746 stop:1075 length:330 start_codon:yes stop_codon:yes gene_type:complete
MTSSEGKKIQYAATHGVDYFGGGPHTLIEGVDGKQIVICDMVTSAVSSGAATGLNLYEGGSIFFKIFPEYANVSMNLSAPIHLGSGLDFKVQNDASTTAWGILVTYYYL